MTKSHDAKNDTPRFDDAYRRAPFSELIRMVLMATDAVVGQLGRPIRPAAAGCTER